MKSSLSLVALAAIAAQTLAQNLGSLPQCALNCALAALPSQCAVTNVTCICSQSSYIESLEPCVEANCSPANQTAALQGAESLCASAGVTLSVSVPQSSPPVTSAPTTFPPATTVTTTSSYAVQSNKTNTTTATPSVFTGAGSAHTYVSGALIAGFGALIALF